MEQVDIGTSARAKKDAALCLSVSVAALTLFALDWKYSLNQGYNLGGVSTVGAERVLNGEFPYRDFWTIYAPGQFYLLALLFRIFGVHLMVERVAAGLICAAATGLCSWLLLRLNCGRASALAAGGILALANWHSGFCNHLGSYPPAIFLAFAAFHLTLSYYETGKRTFLYAAGLALGLVTVFKHDVGGYTTIAVAFGLILAQTTCGRASTESGQQLVRALLLCGAGVVTIILPVVLVFAPVAGIEMIRNLLVFPATDFRYARPEKYPALLPLGSLESLPALLRQSPVESIRSVTEYLIYLVPMVLFLTGLFATVVARARKLPIYVGMTATFSAGYLLHFAAAHVQINTHIVTMSVYSISSAALLWPVLAADRALARSPWFRVSTSILVSGWTLCLVAMPVYRGWIARSGYQTELTIPKISGFRLPDSAAANISDLLAVINEKVPPDGQIYVGLHRHDVIVTNDVLAYFYLGRNSATRFHELHPGIADTKPVQEEMIASLADSEAAIVILKRIFRDETLEIVKADFLRNLPAIGASELDTYIRQNYTKIQQLGDFEVWERR